MNITKQLKQLIWVFFSLVFITSCSTNYNDSVYHHMSSIESSIEAWIKQMEQQYKNDTIDQSILRDEFFYYNRTDLYRDVYLLKNQYELDTNTQEMKDLLRRRRELTRMFYSCENFLMTKEKLSELISVEQQINSFISMELNKVEQKNGY